MKKLGRSKATLAFYQSKVDCHMSDGLTGLLSRSPGTFNKRHTKIGDNNGTCMANGTMRVLRAIWRRTRRQHPELPEPPTMNVDFYPEEGRTAIITNWVSWWSGVQQIVSPVRRAFFASASKKEIRLALFVLGIEIRRPSFNRGCACFVSRANCSKLACRTGSVESFAKRRACSALSR